MFLWFCLQIQIIGFNSELYNNMSHAQVSSNGIVIISLLAQVKVFKFVYQIPILIWMPYFQIPMPKAYNVYTLLAYLLRISASYMYTTNHCGLFPWVRSKWSRYGSVLSISLSLADLRQTIALLLQRHHEQQCSKSTDPRRKVLHTRTDVRNCSSLYLRPRLPAGGDNSIGA